MDDAVKQDDVDGATGPEVPDSGGKTIRLPARALKTLRSGYLRIGGDVRSVSIPLSLLPKNLNHVQRHAVQFRRLIEEEVLVIHGRISLAHATLVHLATVADRGRRILENTFLKQHASLTVEQIVLLQSRVIALTKERNAALERLGIAQTGDKHERLWTAIDASGSEVAG